MKAIVSASRNVVVPLKRGRTLTMIGYGTYQVIPPARIGTNTQAEAIRSPFSTLQFDDQDVSVFLQAFGADVSYSISGDESTSVDLTQIGSRALLFGDSMTDMYNVVNNPSTVVNAGGVLTITDVGSTGLWTGAPVTYWNRTFPSLKKQFTSPCVRLSSTGYTLEVPGARLIADGAVTGTNFVRYPHRMSDMSWVTWLQMYGAPFTVARNVAQSGDTIQDNIDRWDTDVAPYIGTFDMIIAQMPGINDQSVGNGALGDYRSMEAAEQWLELCCSIGVKVFLGLITPVASGESRGTLAIMQRVQRINRFCVEFAKANENLIILDHYRQIVNPSNTTGLAAAGLLKAADNIHYNVPGARKIAAADLAVFQEQLPSSIDTKPVSTIDTFANSAVSVTNGSTTRVGSLVTVTTGSAHGFRTGEDVRINISGGSAPSNDIKGWRRVEAVPTTTSFTFSMDSSAGDFAASAGTITVGQCRNLFPNGLFVNATGGTVNAPHGGVAAANVTVANIAGATNAGLASVQAHPLGFGNVQQLVISTAANGDLTGIQTGGVTSTLLLTMAALQRFVVEMEFKLLSSNWALTPVSEIYATFTIVADGNTYETRIEHNESGVGAGFTVDTTLNLRTPEIQLPAGTVSVTQAYFSVAVRTAAAFSAGPTLTLQWGRPAVWQADI